MRLSFRVSVLERDSRKSGLDRGEGEGQTPCRGGRGTLLGPRDAQLESASLTAPGLGGHGTFSLHKLSCDLDFPRPYGGRLVGLVQLE